VVESAVPEVNQGEPIAADPALVHAERLTVRYSGRHPVRALDGLDLRVPGTGITCLLGANGAGKTTLLEAASGLRPPSEGHVSVLGQAPGSLRNRSRLGVMLQDGGLPGSARPREFLDYVARLYPHSRSVGEVIELVDIADCARTPIRRLSGGQARRVAWAAAMIGNPTAVLLDEPTAALDPVGRGRLHEALIAERDRGTTMLVATHLVEDVEALADYVCVLRSGQLAVAGTPDDLRPRRRLDLHAPAHLRLDGLVDALPAGSSIEEGRPGRYTVRTPHDVDPAIVGTVTSWCAQHGAAPDVAVADLGAALREAISGGQEAPPA
jgi:ABC-2 type transport system ATP-binding protein